MQNLGNVISAGSPICYEQNQCAGEWSAPLTKSNVITNSQICMVTQTSGLMAKRLNCVHDVLCIKKSLLTSFLLYSTKQYVLGSPLLGPTV